MKRILPLLLLFWSPLIADCRLMTRGWSYAELRDEADLVVIATAAEVKETAERTALSDDHRKSDVIGAGIETTFEVRAVLKGDAALKVFILHHYRAAGPGELTINGPGLVSFDPKQKKHFILF